MLNRFDLSMAGMLLRQVREYWWVYLLGMLGIFFTHRLQSELPFIAQNLSEIVLSNHLEEIPYSQYFLIALGIIVIRTGSRNLFFWPGRVLQGNLQEEIVMKVEQSPSWRYHSYSSGQIFQHIVMDIMHLRALVSFGLLQIANFVMIIFVLLPRLISFNEKLIVALTPLLTCTIIFFFILSKTHKYYRKMSELQGNVQNTIIESYDGKGSIKNFQAEKSFIRLFKEGCYRELDAFFKGSLGAVISVPLVKLGVGLSFLWGAYIIYYEGLGSTSLILFSGFIFLFQGPLMYLSWVGVVISRSIGSWKRIKKLLTQIQAESKEELDIKSLNPNSSTVEWTPFNMNLWGQYSSFSLRRNLWNVIIGDTGSGKSTVLEYCAFLFKSRGSHVAYVAQEPHLYNTTIKSNIFLGRTFIPEEIEVAKFWIEVLQLDVLGDDLESIINMEVGENGKRVSGGQAKRICLIRSLLSGADIIIWDDPFSSVDLILERKIIDDIKDSGLLARKTIILTAHRFSTVRRCDHFFHIEREKGLVEKGSVQEMLEKQTGTYEYFKKQMV